jgi:hypothetical protein
MTSRGQMRGHGRSDQSCPSDNGYLHDAPPRVVVMARFRDRNPRKSLFLRWRRLIRVR